MCEAFRLMDSSIGLVVRHQPREFSRSRDVVEWACDWPRDGYASRIHDARSDVASMVLCVRVEKRCAALTLHCAVVVRGSFAISTSLTLLAIRP